MITAPFLALDRPSRYEFHMHSSSEGPGKIKSQFPIVVTNLGIPQYEKAFLLPCLAPFSLLTPISWDNFPQQMTHTQKPSSQVLLREGSLGSGRYLRILVSKNVTVLPSLDIELLVSQAQIAFC